MRNYFYYLLLSLFLVGCDSSPQPFDRIKAFESSPPIFAPNSRYIKQQIIKTEVDEKLESIAVYRYTKLGDILSGNGNYINSKASEFSFEYDYDKNKFKLYSYLFRVNITDGNFIRKNNNQIREYTGYNDRQIFENNSQYKSINYSQDGKLIQSVTEAGVIKIKSDIHWKDGLPINMEITTYNSDELRITTGIEYSYNEKRQIEKMIMLVTSENKTVSSETIFYNYNEYGDWTKATTIRKNQDSNSEVTTTREIEYW